MGARVELRNWATSNVLGLSHRVQLTTMSPEAVIEIGDDVGLSGTTIAAVKAVKIGPRTIVGADVLITDNDHHSLDATVRQRGKTLPGNRVVIGADVFVGARAVILKGVTIGDRAVVAAGAVVATDVPPDHVAVGNPARTRPLAHGVGSSRGRSSALP